MKMPFVSNILNVKHVLLFFILGLTSTSFGQIKSFSDIKNINSPEAFNRVCIENGYEQVATEGFLNFGTEVNRSESEVKSANWAEYCTESYWLNQKIHEWNFQEVDVSWKRENSTSYYDAILSEVKSQCSFYKIIKRGDNNISTYTCPGSTYKGKIGFHISDGDGNISHLIPD